MSMLRRAKKKTASMSMDSRAGRELVDKALGDVGREMVEALVGAITDFEDDTRAKNIKKTIYKTSLKVKFMVDRGDLTHDTLHSKQDVFLEVTQELMENMSLADTLSMESTASAERRQRACVQRASGALRHLSDMMCPLLQGNMQDKNLEKAKQVFDYVSDERFVDALLFKPSMRCYKDTMGMWIELVMGKANPNTQIECKRGSCQEMAAQPKGAFPGSEYCIAHHRANVEQEVKCPSLQSWLNNHHMRRTLRQWTEEESRLQHSLPFIDAVLDYQQIANRSLLPMRARALHKKFVAPDAKMHVPLTPTLLSVVEAGVESTSLSHAFDDAVEFTRAELDTAFQSEFVGCPQYRNWMAVNGFHAN